MVPYEFGGPVYAPVGAPMYTCTQHDRRRLGPLRRQLLQKVTFSSIALSLLSEKRHECWYFPQSFTHLLLSCALVLHEVHYRGKSAQSSQAKCGPRQPNNGVAPPTEVCHGVSAGGGGARGGGGSNDLGGVDLCAVDDAIRQEDGGCNHEHDKKDRGATGAAEAKREEEEEEEDEAADARHHPVEVAQVHAAVVRAQIAGVLHNHVGPSPIAADVSPELGVNYDSNGDGHAHLGEGSGAEG